MPMRPTVEPVDVFPARPDHALELSELAQRSFRGAFGDDNSAADMDAYIQQTFNTDVTREELEDPRNSFLLAGHASAIVGYAKLRRGRPEPCVRAERSIELHRLYVDGSAIGHGLGAALMRACLAIAVEEGFDSMWLGVWQHNDRAIRFYERWGFETVGSHPFVLGSDRQTDLIMERPVTMPNGESSPRP